MAITINGSGITSLEILDGTITDADVNDISASKLTGALPAISGASLTGLPAGGKVLQVVSATSNTSTNANTAWTDIAGLSVTIQPSATTSKIMLMYNAGGMTGSTVNDEISFRINSSEDGNLMEIYRYGYNSTTSGYEPLPLFILYTDSPSSTSSITYKIQGKCGSGDFNINSSSSNSTKSVNVVAMEIGA